MVTPLPTPPWCQVTQRFLTPDAVGLVELLVPLEPMTSPEGQPIANFVRCQASIKANGRPITLSWVTMNGDAMEIMAGFSAEVDRRLREVLAPRIVGADGQRLGRG
jgi:hypothetical protein